MKLGIFLLVFGLILAAIGAVAWQVNVANLVHPYSKEQVQTVQMWDEWAGMLGIGLLVLGGGLALGGIVRMIVKR